MKNIYNTIFRNLSKLRVRQYLALVSILISFFSCNQEDLIIPNVTDSNLELTVSNEILILNQREISNVIDFLWTPGSNKGTGASIEYVLEIDKKGNNFTNAQRNYLGKAIYSKSFTFGEFNGMILNNWADPEMEVILEARVIAVVNSPDVQPDTSAILEFNITPYLPVTDKLYIFGSATEVGWNIANAIELTPSSQDPTIFSFYGTLLPGTFKFPVNRNDDFGQDMYMRDTEDPSKIYLHKGGNPDDNQWEITEPGMYTITISLIDLTIDITKNSDIEVPPFDNIYIVGDGCSSGWNIDTPEPFIQSDADPMKFIYEGLLSVGNIKFLAGSTGDWCGDWYRPLNDAEPLTSTEVEQNSGCDVDNKWGVTSETAGFYKITLDTRDVTVKFKKITVYMIGDAGPNGWNISSPTPMNTANDGIFTYSGPLTEGELKFSKFMGDWCDGDWLNAATADQTITDGQFITTFGCSGPDNKWRVTSATAGNYDITVNLNTKTINIVKQ
ncbi:MAG: SusF/SusE family outer membrane protein [Bacteroidales bacterium]|nr:SusF/SusE family outer membrane protein [Bacteroidales bacterium]